MTPEDILETPPILLSEDQRRQYFADGFLTIPDAIPPEWIDRLRMLSDEFLDSSRRFSVSDNVYDLGPRHSPHTPHVRRLKALVDRHPDFWAFASNSPLTDIAVDLLGPHVKFHSGKLNYKSPGGGEIVKWHQDVSAWPHTNYSLVTLGVHLDDVGHDDGPLSCVPGSHDGELFEQRDTEGRWTGAIADEDLEAAGIDRAVDMTGGAGTVIAIHCRVVHGSRSNSTARTRALPLFVFASADAFAWMPAPSPTTKTGQIVRGEPAKVAHLDPRPCPVPPDWAKEGYGSIFTAQTSK
jgi:ectoine hydroxylase